MRVRRRALIEHKETGDHVEAPADLMLRSLLGGAREYPRPGCQQALGAIRAELTAAICTKRALCLQYLIPDLDVVLVTTAHTDVPAEQGIGRYAFTMAHDIAEHCVLPALTP
jgi:hypothetical protein